MSKGSFKLCFVSQALPAESGEQSVRLPHAVRPVRWLAGSRTNESAFLPHTEDRTGLMYDGTLVTTIGFIRVFQRCFDAGLLCGGGAPLLSYRAGGDGEEQEDPARQEDCLRLEGCGGKWH